MRKVEAHVEKRADFAKAVGRRIREARTKRGLSRAHVASVLGYEDSASVAGWELARNVPPPFLLPEIADLLGVTLDYLLRGE